MKTRTFFTVMTVAVMLFAGSVNAFAQEEPLMVCDEMPEYPGGTMQLLTFLQKNIKYPEASKVTQTEGRVLVSFVVEKDGSFSNLEIAKSVDPIIDAEVMRVMGLMDKWTPGKQDGKPVRVKYTLPIHFRLPTPPRNAIVVKYGMEDGQKVVNCLLTNNEKISEEEKKATIEMKDLAANLKKLGKKKAEGMFVLPNNPDTMDEFNALEEALDQIEGLNVVYNQK